MRPKYIIVIISRGFSRGQKSRGPFEKPHEMADNLYCQHAKKHHKLFESAVQLVISCPSACDPITMNIHQ